MQNVEQNNKLFYIKATVLTLPLFIVLDLAEI